MLVARCATCFRPDRDQSIVAESRSKMRAQPHTFQALHWPFPPPSLFVSFLISSFTASRNLGSVGFPLLDGMVVMKTRKCRDLFFGSWGRYGVSLLGLRERWKLATRVIAYVPCRTRFVLRLGKMTSPCLALPQKLHVSVLQRRHVRRMERRWDVDSL
jgi:hypothetical protein